MPPTSTSSSTTPAIFRGLDRQGRRATWRHAWELKVFGYINLTRAIYAQMKARGHGVIRFNDIGAPAKVRRQLICAAPATPR